MKTVIRICGTSGSGKTTVMKAVMDSLEWNAIYTKGRKRPLYYRSVQYPTLIVLGHYEIDCGGCDTIGSAPKVYETLQGIEFGQALTEGLLWSEDVRWASKLAETAEVKSVYLNTDVEECLHRVVLRQNGREPVDPARVRSKLTRRVGTIESARRRLGAAGIQCVLADCATAERVILQWVRNSCVPKNVTPSGSSR